MDYGTLMCTASNQVGIQKEPCVFHIIMAGKQYSSLQFSTFCDLHPTEDTKTIY